MEKFKKLTREQARNIFGGINLSSNLFDVQCGDPMQGGNGQFCPGDLCCSKLNYCGNTPSYCGTDWTTTSCNCQEAYGLCRSWQTC